MKVIDDGSLGFRKCGPESSCQIHQCTEEDDDLCYYNFCKKYDLEGEDDQLSEE